MKKTSKNIIPLIMMVTLNLAALTGLYFIYSQITAINKEAALVMSDIETQTAKKADDKALKSILDSTKEDRAKIDTYLLTDDDVVSFIETIEGLGELSNTQVVTSSVNIDDSGTSKTGYLTLRINVLGSFENTLHFISLVESVPHQVSINKLTSAITTSDEKSREWQSNFELRVLKLKN